jgi:type I restriction enzyme S subunit
MSLSNSEWKEFKFEDFFLVPLKNGLNKPSRIRGEGLPMINMKEIFGYDIIDDSTPMELVPVDEKEKAFLLDKDDLLFARQSLVESGAGKVSIFKGSKETVFESHLIRCRIDKLKGIPDYFYYLFRSPQGKGTVSTIVEQTAAAGIRGSDLKKLQFIFPPLPEQKAIAGILSSLDDKIDLLHKQNKTLEALAETLFRQWFMERRPELVEGEANESWEVGTIEEEFDFIMGQSPLGTSLNENKEGMIFYQGRTDFDFRFPKPRVYTTTTTRLAKKFDTLISVRAPVGDMNMAIEECCLGRGVAAFRYKHNNAFYSYTYYKMRSIMEQIKQFEDSGTVFGSIGKDDFKKLENIIPPQKMIEDFQNRAKPLDDKIFSNINQIRALTKLRDTLLPKLMSGEVRVDY